MKLIDNKTDLLRDNLISSIKEGDKVAIAATCFSIYAFKELKEQLTSASDFRLLFTSPSFLNFEGADKKSATVLSEDNASFSTEFEKKFGNDLNQKAIAREFAEWIKSDKVQIRSNSSKDHIMGFAAVQAVDKKQLKVYTPLYGFTMLELGCSDKQDNYNLVQELEMPFSKQYLDIFDSIWRDKKKFVDVKQVVLEKISAMCAENSPEFVYYVALHNIFSEFLKDISDDDFFANERVGFKNSVIWNKLFDFQKDAALAIINKLERFNGCILADSVGLGKTYTALAVIKYYESRNKSVLVLCPKKLSENWNSFRSNYINNPLVKDKFGYTVLYHTDLSRIHVGAQSNGIDLGRLNWGNFDLVVIDESHNFRNGGNTTDDKQNRYQVLMEKVIRSGVKTKVLMLSATPVNNRFNDLRNQLQLAYEDGDPSFMEEKLNTRNTIDGIFRKAQEVFNKWSNFESSNRTTETLLKMLDFDFFELLDSVTIARSRKNIKAYYNVNAIGAFPKRLPPISLSPALTSLNNVASYDQIYADLLSLTLSIYTPSHYILPQYRHLYTSEKGNKMFSQAFREQGLRRLMAINLMKRLESSVYSFKLTLSRIVASLENTIERIDNFIVARDEGYIETITDDVFEDEIQDDGYSVGKKSKIRFRHMDVRSWKSSIIEDKLIIQDLLKKIAGIDVRHDLKLYELASLIAKKIKNPINAGNKKMLIFTAFADTAEYLYDSLQNAIKKAGLNMAVVTGKGDGKSTIAGLPTDFNTILTCFSPRSKERDAMQFDSVASTANIDILIGTDCISEGQNLQDCDYCVNYDIHWNPVRIIQRYGRIDRIGSTNTSIQLVNFWPDVSLDEYINLKQKIETRMKIVNITATPEEQVLSDEEKIDLAYRKAQLEKLKDEVIDIEDVSSSISITDLGLNDFKLDLLDYTKNRSFDRKISNGIYAVVPANAKCPSGLIFILKNTSMKAKTKTKNRLHPFYMVYISKSGNVIYNHLDSKSVLTVFRNLCKGQSSPIESLCKQFNAETLNGNDMTVYSTLLNKAIRSILEVKKESEINSLFKLGGTVFSANEKIEGLDDFEIVCFLVVK